MVVAARTGRGTRGRNRRGREHVAVDQGQIGALATAPRWERAGALDVSRKV